MQILEIESNRKYKLHSATIVLNYKELRYISNCLYEQSETEEYKDNSEFWEIYRNMSFLFDIVKNGAVDNWTFDSGAKMTRRIRDCEKALKEREKDNARNIVQS